MHIQLSLILTDDQSYCICNVFDRCPSSLQKMLILLFAVLLSWPYLL